MDFVDPKHGLCAGCHAGPMLNETNKFSEIVFGIPVGTRFQNILVSLFMSRATRAGIVFPRDARRAVV